MRLADFADAAESGITEMTGRLRRGGDRDDVVGRFGGIKKSYPELAVLSAGPKRIAAAIRRGSGRTFDDIRSLMQLQMEREGFKPGRKRSPGRPTVAPHLPIIKCRHCGEMHTKGQHRFHGKGSFHRTHLWAFNPPAAVKPERIGQASKIFYLRDQGNRQGNYYHKFTKSAAGVWTYSPGWHYFNSNVAVIR
jgi:hypothetical protein